MNKLNKKRFFAFGCSYTSHHCATWADYIGVNFDEYYNFARSGACNTFILDKFIEADKRYSFNSETDYIVVMFTSFERFSYYNKDGWKLNGSLLINPNELSNFVKEQWSMEWALYSSYIAISTIDTILKLKNTNHKLLFSLDVHDNDIKTPEFGFFKRDVCYDFLKQIYHIIPDTPMDVWKRDNFKNKKDYYEWIEGDSKYTDGHPTHFMHLQYIKEKFPQFYTKKSIDLFNEADSIFLKGNANLQGLNYNEKIHKKINLVYNQNLF